MKTIQGSPLDCFADLDPSLEKVLVRYFWSEPLLNDEKGDSGVFFPSVVMRKKTLAAPVAVR